MPLPSPTRGSAALITGASSGIGRESARQLAERGHDLVIVARREGRLVALAQELREAHGRRVEVVACDVSEPESRAALLREVDALEVQIDVMVLAAGFGLRGPLVEQDGTRLQLMMRTNLEGVVGLVQAVAPAMTRRRTGAILIVSSIAGTAPWPNFSVYAASKAALNSFGEAVHEELRPSGVTVSLLCPGNVDTEFASVAELAAADLPKSLNLSAWECAAAGLDALDQGRRKVVPRPAVRALNFFSGHLPRPLWLRVCNRYLS